MTFLLGIIHLSAQIDYDKFPEVTSTYLINDVHIQKSPTDSFGLGDILIKDGFISQVARNITAPADAYVIEGDSAYVYPAFIDALSHTGIAKKEDKGDRPKVKFQGYPPNSVVGITPEVLAYKLVDPSQETIKKMKSNGFAVSHVVPRGKMLPGQGSVMLLSGETNEEMLLGEAGSMYFQLAGTRGFYPTTVIGVMAKWRDLYRQATYLDKHQAVSKASAGPAKRAKADKSLQALVPVTKKQQTVFMKAEKAKDIHRAIALQQDLGYKLVLAEVKQAGPALDKIKKLNIPVLISAKLPKEVKEKGAKDKKDKGKQKDMDKKSTADKNKTSEKPAAKKKAKKEDSPEVKAMKERKKKSYDAYVGQAAALEKAGVPFAFSFLDSKPEDLKKTLKRMMKAGLSQSGAFAALTTQPAKVLGIDKQVGTIANGKMANLFLTTAPYFSDDANIKYTFVEGDMTEFEIKPKKKKGEGSEDFKKTLAGRWSYEVETPMGTYDGVIEISGDEDMAVKVISSDAPGDPMIGRDIEVGDQSLTYVTTLDMGGGSMEMTTSVDVDGDSMTGTVEIDGMGSMPITGTKLPE